MRKKSFWFFTQTNPSRVSQSKSIALCNQNPLSGQGLVQIMPRRETNGMLMKPWVSLHTNGMLIKADAGVGPSIAWANQVCNCAYFPTAAWLFSHKLPNWLVGKTLVIVIWSSIVFPETLGLWVASSVLWRFVVSFSMMLIFWVLPCFDDMFRFFSFWMSLLFSFFKPLGLTKS